MFTSNNFDLDPTDPRFKNLSKPNEILEEKRKRKLEKNESNFKNQSKSIDVNSLAESVKKKSNILLQKQKQEKIEPLPKRRKL